jgi:drug/metabolite transporter (DMT)-like permease
LGDQILTESRETPRLASGSKTGARAGELWALAGVLAFAVAFILDRTAVSNADPMVGPVIFGVPSLVLGILLVFVKGTLGQLHPRSPHYIGRRAIVTFVIPGVLSSVGLLAYYFALRLGGVAITAPVQQTFIIWGAVAGWLFLGERLGRGGVFGIGVLVAGLLVLTLGQLRGVPVSESWYYAVPLSLVTAAAYGVSGVLWRDGQLRGADQSIGILIQFLTSELTSMILVVGLGKTQRLFEAPGQQIGTLLASGVLSGIVAVYCLFTSLRLMSVARTYTFYSLIAPVAAVLAYIFLKEEINGQMMIGILMVCLAVALVERSKPSAQPDINISSVPGA